MTKAAELAKMGEVLTNSQIGGRRNIIINGAMQVAQRGTSETGVNSSGYSDAPDRFRIAYEGSSSQFTVSQDTNAPAGFKTSYKIQCTTADSSLAATSQVGLLQRIEAQNLQHLKYGLSSAEKVTLSFYVKSNTTGTYAVNLYSQDGNRIIGTTYSISSADTWEQKILTFDGDTGGTINNDNGKGIEVKWFISAGSTYTATDNTSWGAYADGKIAYGHAVDLADSTSDNWAITGVQLEVGSQATPFEHRSFGEELDLCQRYYYKQADGSENASQSVGVAFMESSSVVVCCIDLPTTMRATPSNVSSSVTDGFQFYRNGAADNFTDTYIANAHPNIFTFFNHTQVSGTAGQAGSIKLNSSATSYIAVDAEL